MWNCLPIQSNIMCSVFCLFLLQGHFILHHQLVVDFQKLNFLFWPLYIKSLTYLFEFMQHWLRFAIFLLVPKLVALAEIIYDNSLISKQSVYNARDHFWPYFCIGVKKKKKHKTCSIKHYLYQQFCACEHKTSCLCKHLPKHKYRNHALR